MRGRDHAREGRSRADAVTLILSDATIEDSAEVADGIEVLDVSKCTGDPQALAAVSFELPEAA